MVGNSRPIILYVEDYEPCRKITLDCMTRRFSEYNIKALNCGNEFEKEASGDLENVVMIVSDNLIPPGSTGEEIISRYYEKFKAKRIKCLFHCADATKIMNRFLVDERSVMALDKPCDTGALLAKMQEALGISSSLSQ